MELQNMEALHDDELLDLYLKGYFQAFEALYARHKGGSFRFMYRQVNDINVAEDLLQELWIKVVDSHSQSNL